MSLFCLFKQYGQVVRTMCRFGDLVDSQTSQDFGYAQIIIIEKSSPFCVSLFLSKWLVLNSSLTQTHFVTQYFLFNFEIYDILCFFLKIQSLFITNLIYRPIITMQLSSQFQLDSISDMQLIIRIQWFSLVFKYTSTVILDLHEIF